MSNRTMSAVGAILCACFVWPTAALATARPDAGTVASAHHAKDATLRVVVRSLPGRLSAKIILTGPHHVHKRVSRSVRLKLPAGAYSLSAAPVKSSSGSYYATTPSSRVVLRAGKATRSTVVYATLVPKTTVVVPAGATVSLTDDPSGPRVLTITGSAARAVRVGDSLSSGVTSAAPYGYLVKVTKVAHKSGSSATLDVENTTLLAALPTGEINSTATLQAPASAASLRSFTPAEQSPTGGMIVRSIGTRSPRVHTAGFSLQTTNLTCTTSAGVHIEDPTVTFTPSISLQAKWGFLKVESATFTATLNEAITLGVDVEAGAKCETNDPGIGLLPQPITLPDVDVQVGPVPVIISPTLQLYLSGSAGITAKASASLTQTASATVGANYSHGTITPISSVSNNFTPAFSAEGDASAEVALTPTVDTKIYDVAGPSFDMGVAAKFDANTSKNPWWTLQGCLQGGVGFVVELLDIDWSDPHLLSLCKTLLSANGGHPGGGGGGTGSPGPPGLPNPPGGGSTGNGGATSIAAGPNDACAVLVGGQIDCWGFEDYGQLGDGEEHTVYRTTPVQVRGVTGATDVTLGEIHSCALVAGGQVDCWGANGSGELGNGELSGDELTPVTVSGVSGATEVSAGSEFTCALLGDGQVDCWGIDELGQLGDGMTVNANEEHCGCIPTPAAVRGVTAATAIATGANHACAVLASGQVECWGNNQFHQLGDGSQTSYSSTPVLVSGITDATSVSAGERDSCARLATGQAECWGDNQWGQLGNGSTVGYSGTPVFVSGITNADATTTGIDSCALLAGAVACWGDASGGQLGQGFTGGTVNAGSAPGSPIPVEIIGVEDATAVAEGGGSTCVLLPDSAVECWGIGEAGQLGDGTTVNSEIPVAASGLP